ncbi:hypothetical protein ACJJTC_006873 [Scirpophaga incertulas]
MDQYTSDLLCKWGLIEYVNIFADARIDITTLQLIGDNEITALISTIGDRLRLKSNLEIWKKELGTSASSELPLSPVRPIESFVNVTFLIYDPSVSEENLTILESPDPGPWQQVEKYWNSTVCARLRYLYYEKGTLTDYLNRFPILKSSSGFTLLLQDYENLYPKNTAGMTNLIYV